MEEKEEGRRLCSTPSDTNRDCDELMPLGIGNLPAAFRRE
jgi:hypothetical protein